MNTRSFVIELLDDLVLSQSSATTGGHVSLDYIPGATLLGAVAARLYQAAGTDSWLVFHSGKVRFGNGYPLTKNGVATFPVPLCLYQEKGKEADLSSGAGIYNLSATTPTALRRQQVGQLKQIRGKYITQEGDVVVSQRHSRLKTAIDPQTGRAAEAQLFGYESLKAGQRFSATLSWDDDVPVAQIEAVLAALNGNLLLGRSRSAQYGQVSVSQAAASPIFPSVGGERLTLLALSDLALSDKLGQPLLTPEDLSLGLSGLQLELSFTHLRVRSYSPYNAWRKSYDTQRQVIGAGSVLSFRKLPDFDPATLQCLHSGVGNWRESGLGQLWVDPAILAGETLQVRKEQPVAENRTVIAPISPETHMIKWLQGQLDRGNQRSEDDHLLVDLEKDLCVFYLHARTYAGAAPGTPVGPGKTQWGDVASSAARVRNKKELLLALFGNEPDTDRKEGKDETHVCKRGDEAWGVEVPEKGKLLTFRDWFYRRLSDPVLRDALYGARRIAEIARTRKVMNIREGKGETL